MKRNAIKYDLFIYLFEARFGLPSTHKKFSFPRKFDLDKRQKVEGQHKGQKQFGILIL